MIKFTVNLHAKDEKIGTINVALYRRLKKGSLFELETAINQLSVLSSGRLRTALNTLSRPR